MLENGTPVLLKNNDIDYIKYSTMVKNGLAYVLDSTSDTVSSSEFRVLSDDELKEKTSDYKFAVGDIVVEYDPDSFTPWKKTNLFSGEIKRIAIRAGEALYKLKGRTDYFPAGKLCRALVKDEDELFNLKKKGERIFSEDDLLALTQFPAERKNLKDIYLVEDIMKNLHSFINLYTDDERIKKNGLVGIRPNILMSGPPGNGKTVLAAAIAEKLHLPIYIADMSKIRGRFVGTAVERIGSLMDMIKNFHNTGCVLFLDECDSIATTRLYGQGCEKDDSAALNILLTKLDTLGRKIIVIAATNFKDELDEAFVRRFTLRLFLDKPDTASIKKYVYSYMGRQGKEHNLKICDKDINEIIIKANGQSWSRIDEMCSNYIREKILGNGYSLDSGWVGLNEKKRMVMGFCG